jgi:hypothetical protein
MNSSKKSTEEFIKDVIVPIEQNSIDKGNLYVLIKSRPTQDYTEYQETPDWYYDHEDWSLPTENRAGDWLEGEHLKLKTLSGLLWGGSSGGRLYEADYQGEKSRIAPTEFFSVYDDYQKSDIAARQYLDQCISLGIEVKKARLLTRIKFWRPYFLWSFALDCIERAYSYEKYIKTDVYKEGIIFARAHAKYKCDMGSIELEKILNAPASDKSFYSLVLKKNSDLSKSISEQSALGSEVYLRKAILEAFNPNKPFQIANYVRTAMAWHSLGEYRDEYLYPGLACKPENRDISNRLWYAFHKRELDWQVSHLSMLIGE